MKIDSVFALVVCGLVTLTVISGTQGVTNNAAIGARSVQVVAVCGGGMSTGSGTC